MILRDSKIYLYKDFLHHILLYITSNIYKIIFYYTSLYYLILIFYLFFTQIRFVISIIEISLIYLEALVLDLYDVCYQNIKVLILHRLANKVSNLDLQNQGIFDYQILSIYSNSLIINL